MRLLDQGNSISEIATEKEGSLRKIGSVRFLGIGLVAFVLTFSLAIPPLPAADDGAKLAEHFLKKIPLTPTFSESFMKWSCVKYPNLCLPEAFA
jgi:hypothetical protein